MTDTRVVDDFFDGLSENDADVEGTLQQLDALIEGNRQAQAQGELQARVGFYMLVAVFCASFFLSLRLPIIVGSILAAAVWIEGSIIAGRAGSVETDNQLRRRIYLLTLLVVRVGREQRTYFEAK